jgi:spore coat polysaccharide biosynthesis protein SpsF
VNSDTRDLQIDIIVEARMGSTRLPGKVMLPVNGKPFLEIMIERLRLIKGVHNIIIASTVNPADSIIERLAKKLGVGCYRGSEDDVLLRVVEAARHFGTDVIVEITGDDALVDPSFSSQVVETYIKNRNNIDIVANDFEQIIPLGFYTRAFSRKSLEIIASKTCDPLYRENVEAYYYNHKSEFRWINIDIPEIFKRPDIRLTLDTPDDYEVMKIVVESLYPQNPAFSGQDIIGFLDTHPEIKAINQQTKQNSIQKQSL